MPITLGALAAQLKTTVIGDATITIERICHPKEATQPGELALILDEKIVPLAQQLPIQTAIVPEGVSLPNIPNQLVVKRPKVALAFLLQHFSQPPYCPNGIHPSAVVDPSAQVAASAIIGPHCWVGPNAIVGENTRLLANVTLSANSHIDSDGLVYPGVYIGERVFIGKNVIIHANTVIGSDGFSFVTEEPGSVESGRQTLSIQAINGKSIKIPSVGVVVIEDDVEIGAGCCIDRATLAETRIKRGAKLDNMIQIAHNVVIGEDCLVAAQAGVAGSVKVGNRAVLGGQVGIADHLNIGEDSVVVSKGAVIQDVPNKTVVLGMPAITPREMMQKELDLKKIKKLVDETKLLKRRIEQLETALYQNNAIEEERPMAST